MTIESFSTILFNQWQIGHAKLGNQDWNTGILLLVSKGDRRGADRAGGGWGRREDATARRVMDSLIVPRFKEDSSPRDPVRGRRAGCDGPEAGTSDGSPAHVPLPDGAALFLGLAVFTAVSMIRRGSNGWAWLMWGVVFSILGTVLYHMLDNRGSGGGGGGGFGGARLVEDRPAEAGRPDRGDGSVPSGSGSRDEAKDQAERR